MPDLTLDQVREAGRFAWCEAYLYLPGLSASGVLAHYATPGGYRVGVDNGGSDAAFSRSLDFSAYNTRGWHYLAGCDCEFCRS